MRRNLDLVFFVIGSLIKEQNLRRLSAVPQIFFVFPYEIKALFWATATQFDDVILSQKEGIGPKSWFELSSQWNLESIEINRRNCQKTSFEFSFEFSFRKFFEEKIMQKNTFLWKQMMIIKSFLSDNSIFPRWNVFEIFMKNNKLKKTWKSGKLEKTV